MASNRRLVLALIAAAGPGCGGSGSKEAEEPTSEPSDTVYYDDNEADTEDSGDGMEVSGLKGTLDVAEIQPVIEKDWRGIQKCFSKETKKARFVGGHVTMRFRVNRDGSVKHVQLEDSDLGAWPVEKCVLDLARAMRFPEPDGGEAVFSFPADFPPARPTEAMVDETALAKLQPLVPELDACAEETGAAMPDKVLVTLYVGKGGAVQSVGFATTAEQPFADAWAECASARVMAWKLVDPKGKIHKTQVWYRE